MYIFSAEASVPKNNIVLYTANIKALRRTATFHFFSCYKIIATKATEKGVMVEERGGRG